MTFELNLLLFSTLLHFIWIAISARTAIKEYGLSAQIGARDKQPEPSVFLSRTRRLVSNSQENLLLFAIVIVAAHLAGVRNELTVFGAQLYFFGRLLHGIIYLAGWPIIRPIAWLVSVIGTVTVAVAIYQA